MLCMRVRAVKGGEVYAKAKQAMPMRLKCDGRIGCGYRRFRKQGVPGESGYCVMV